MSRRQTITRQWLIVDRSLEAKLWSALRKLQRGSGVLVISALEPGERRQLRHLARLRCLIIVEEDGNAARVHNVGELRHALLRRTALILISPINHTRSHPDWTPLPRMRAATLARLANRQAIALGGMDARRYAKVAQLGFIGWAGISAFRT